LFAVLARLSSFASIAFVAVISGFAWWAGGSLVARATAASWSNGIRARVYTGVAAA
jgi:hypothetical protein